MVVWKPSQCPVYMYNDVSINFGMLVSELDRSISLEMPYKDLLNALISFEIRHFYNSNYRQSKKASKQQKQKQNFCSIDC